MAHNERVERRTLFWRLGNVPQPFSPMSEAMSPSPETPGWGAHNRVYVG